MIVRATSFRAVPRPVKTTRKLMAWVSRYAADNYGLALHSSIIVSGAVFTLFGIIINGKLNTTCFTGVKAGFS